jgi:hypothetical protein
MDVGVGVERNTKEKPKLATKHKWQRTTQTKVGDSVYPECKKPLTTPKAAAAKAQGGTHHLNE